MPAERRKEMYCAKCGAQLKDGASFCHVCGTSSAARSVTGGRPAPQGTAPQVVYAPGEHPFNRLGGFLMVLVVYNYISGPAFFIQAVLDVYWYGMLLYLSSYLPSGLTILLVFVMLGSMALEIIGGVDNLVIAGKIRRKDPTFLYSIQSSSLALLISSTVFFAFILIFSRRFSYYGIVITTYCIIDWAIITIRWLALVIASSVYCGTSVRVRTFMGSDAYLRRSVFNRSTVSPVPADGSYNNPQYNSPRSNAAPYAGAGMGAGSYASQPESFAHDPAVAIYNASVNSKNRYGDPVPPERVRGTQNSSRDVPPRSSAAGSYDGYQTSGYSSYQGYVAGGYDPYGYGNQNAGYPSYQGYAAGEYDPYAAMQTDMEEETGSGKSSIWKAMTLIGVITGILLVGLAIIMISFAEAELGFVIALVAAAVLVVFFAIFSAVKYVKSE